jgi:hypothetical protein
MARITYFFCIVLLFFLAGSCIENKDRNEQKFPKKINALMEGNLSSPSVNGAGETDVETYSQQPEVSLKEGEQLIQIFSVNLDQDAVSEQIIIVKDIQSREGAVKMIIADFDGSLGRSVRTWETNFGAVNERTIRIDVKDVVGDRSLQIVASGITERGTVFLDVFKPLFFGSSRLTYTPICRLEANGSIDIIENEQSVEFGGGRRFGESFPIVIFRSNPEAGYYSDTIRDTYSYNSSTATYELAHSETMQAEKSGEAQLASLFQSAAPEPYKNYIKGIWYKTDEEGLNEEKLLAFDPTAEEIAFYTKGAQEVYRWKYSRRSLYNTLEVYTENALLKSIQPNITVTLHSPDALSIAITEYSAMDQWLNEQWGGKYTRLNDKQVQEHEKSFDGSRVMKKPFLAGEYKTGSGISITFHYPAFQWKDQTKNTQGGFTVIEFPSNNTIEYILSLKVIEDQGLKNIELFYVIKTPDKQKGDTLLTSFTLEPALTTVYGIQELKEQPLTFVRSEDN